MREFTFNQGGNEKSPREDLTKIFSFSTTHEILLNELYISINDETCSCKYNLTLIPSSSLVKVSFTYRLIFGNIGIRDR